MFVDDSDILIQSEYRAGEQERLRHVVEQPRRHVVDMDHLISHERDTAHDEQHRTSVLRDFEALVVFHGVRKSYFFTFLPLHHATSSGTEDEGDDVTDRLKDCLNRLVHNCDVLNGE
jgi:hypothetical protein